MTVGRFATADASGGSIFGLMYQTHQAGCEGRLGLHNRRGGWQSLPMRWVLRKFWDVLGLFGFLVGIFYLPADTSSIEIAFNAWGEHFTVGNREIALFILCLICIARLFYIDLNRALNEPEWVPVRKRLTRGLAVIFSRDARVAEIKLISDDKAIIAYKKAAAAKIILENENFDHIPHLSPPPQVEPLLSAGAGNVISDQIQDQERRILGRVSQICGCVGPVETGAFERRLMEKLKTARDSAYNGRAHWEHFENNGWFLNDHHRNRFHELRCETDAINKASDEFKTSLERIERECLRSIDADIRSELLFDSLKET